MSVVGKRASSASSSAVASDTTLGPPGTDPPHAPLDYFRIADKPGVIALCCRRQVQKFSSSHTLSFAVQPQSAKWRPSGEGTAHGVKIPP
jgi:hypothetical protein